MSKTNSLVQVEIKEKKILKCKKRKSIDVVRTVPGREAREKQKKEGGSWETGHPEHFQGSF